MPRARDRDGGRRIAGDDRRGVAIGLPFAWSSGKVIGTFLFRAAPDDPSALVVPIAALLTAALIAAGFAACIDPMMALRHE
jgi:hypothetical protein